MEHGMAQFSWAPLDSECFMGRSNWVVRDRMACPYFFFVLGFKPLSVTKKETLSFLPCQQLNCLNPKSKNPNLPKPQNNHVLFRLTLFNGRPKLRL